MIARVKPHKQGNLRVNVYATPKDRSSYENILTKDPNRIAQVLMDLIVLGFPIERAIVKLKERIKKKDWFG